MLNFHANIYAVPAGVAPSAPLLLRGSELAPLRTPDGRPPTFDAFHSVTFETAYDALTALPRLDAEPDGFFVIAGDAEERRWQLDGHLFDFGERLHRVELHGDCPPETLDAVLACLGWPATTLAFELVLEGIVLDEPSFRSYAAG
ncbi:MAG: hypothetical protein KF688_16755 [Pirellulales bacterium]|nr:hypothetical protein [Pirellulales bacterium]